MLASGVDVMKTTRVLGMRSSISMLSMRSS